MHKVVLIAFFICFLLSIHVNSQVPHLQGKIKISITNGTIDADLTLNNLPSTNDYSIWLNAGLNIEYFRDLYKDVNYTYNTEYKPEQSSEAFQHYFPSNDQKTRFLPAGFNIKYMGKFPVIRDTSKAYTWGDWKGNIAFNGRTLRASEQSAWYPIIYDKRQDLIINKYTYTIEVECLDGETIYLNGDVPKSIKKGIFESKEAVALLLFSGIYDYIRSDSIYVLNSTLTGQKLKTLINTTNKIIDFYEQILNTKYGKPVVYLSSTPVSKKNEWMFVTYPTVAVIGINQYKLDNYFDDATGYFKEKSNITFIAHELGHYYFGTKFVPNNTLRWFFLEGMADYLSIKAAKQILGDVEYNKIISSYIKMLDTFTPIPLNKITSPNEINETFRYRFAPLLLIAIEKKIGEKKMQDWLRLLVQTKNTFTNYEFMIASLSQIVKSEELMNEILNNFIISHEAKQNILKYLSE